MSDESCQLPAADSPSWPVAVFAHNEQEHIQACLDSLYSAAPGRELEIFVLANGCTDSTEDIVAEYARNHRGVRLVPIQLGDKANAWNVYIHDIAPERDTHFFIDGDIKACPEAFLRLHDALSLHPEAHAAAGFPTSGRSLEEWRRTMLRQSWLAGNLYALRGSFVKRVRQYRVRLPVGWVFEDGLVGALAKWDLDPSQAWDPRRIVPCLEAGFRFDSLSWFRLDHWRLYWRRRIRYSTGFYQDRILGAILKREGLAGMSSRAQDVYRKSQEKLRTRRAGLNIFFDWIALRRIQKERRRPSSRKPD
jgi:glycosyltransferase involved in cell wall biosynthesis